MTEILMPITVIVVACNLILISRHMRRLEGRVKTLSERVNPYGRHTLMNWRRRLALQESHALRHLLRAHGRIRPLPVNRWDIY